MLFYRAAFNSRGVMLLGTRGDASDTGKLYQLVNGHFNLLAEGREDVISLANSDTDDAVVPFRKGTFRYAMNKDGTYGPSGNRISKRAFYEMQFDRGTLWATGFSPRHLFSFEHGHWQEHMKLTNAGDPGGWPDGCVAYGIAVLPPVPSCWVPSSARISRCSPTPRGRHLRLSMPVGWLGEVRSAFVGSVWVTTQYGPLIFSDAKDSKYQRYEPPIKRQ